MSTLRRTLAEQKHARAPGALVLLLATLTPAGCGRREAATPAVGHRETLQEYAAPQVTQHRLAIPHFTDVLPASGIAFRHHFLNSETGANYRISPYDHG